MSTVVVRRPQRRAAPDLPSGEIVLEAPPEIPRAQGRQYQQMMMMLPMMAGTGAMGFMMSANMSGPLRWVMGGVMGMSALGMLGMGAAGGGASRSDMAYARRMYLRGLSQHRVRVLRAADQQRAALAYLHPDPQQLWAMAASYRLWERRREDADFGVARIGRGPQSLATTLVPPATKPLESLEPLSAGALRRFITTYTAVPDLPAAMAVNGFARVYFTGDQARGRDLARAIVAQLAVFHAPEDLLVAVCAPAQLHDEWEWTKWLPHGLHPGKTDAVGPVRLFAPSAIALEAILEDLLADRPRFDPSVAPRSSGPHLIVVLDGGDTVGSNHLMTDGGLEGLTLLDLTNQPPRLLDTSEVIFDLDDDGTLTSETVGDELQVGIADALSALESQALARQLTPLRLSASSTGDQAMTTELGLAELLDLGDPYEFDPADTWIPRPNRDRLRVRFGVAPDGTPIELDLKESAQDGMGPHGLLIGATGSGKSELLRTLVLGLAVTHSSNSLNFVLIDFKGGATFSSLDRLPHTSAVITNLADELPLVDRMTDALNGEMLRRQELLRASGHYASLRDYERARQAGAPLEEVPSLLVVCDEFSELLSAKPDFIDMFVQIGRLGRSLGVHLLLASQRLEEGRLRGLDTHLSYRIGLRTFSSTESRIVLGSADAYELPKAPGHGYLKVGTEPLARFRAAYVSGVLRRVAGQPRGGDDALAEVREYTPSYVAPLTPDEQDQMPPEPDDDAVGESLMDVIVERLRGRGKPAHQVWLPPLREPLSLDRLLPGLVQAAGRGLTTSATDQHGALRATIGVIDRPIEQRHDPLVLDLAAGAGHVAIVGGPQTGKSTVLRTMMMSLALTHTPAEVQFYCIDLGGGSLAGLRGLPHTGWVAARQDPGAIRRTIAEMGQLLLYRERRFAELGLDSMVAYRRWRRDGNVVDDPFGDVFLFVDGWVSLRTDFEDLELVVTDLAARGLSYGIHVVVTAARWFDLRASIRDVFGSRIELRIGDPADSGIDRKAALNVPANEPGRGITTTRHQMLVSLPRLDGLVSTDDLAEGVANAVRAIAQGWSGPSAPAVRMLPATVDYDSLTVAPGGSAVPIGIAEQDLSAVHIDFANDPNFMLFGETECGKTGFLRMLARRIIEHYPPEEARIAVIDYRRGLLDTVPPEYLIGYGTNQTVSDNLVREIAAALEPRLPGPDVTAEQLRNRSWWSGMQIFVLVDDYDLVGSGGADPLAALVPYLPQARDVGLHLILARRSAGAGRTMYLPLLSALRDSGASGLVMSGDRDEGPLLGSIRPESLPPGRGWLVDRRGESQLIQTAWTPPSA